MGNYSIEDIKEYFDTYINPTDLSRQPEDPVSLYDTIWPCLLEECQLEAERRGFNKEFMKEYQEQIMKNLQKIHQHLSKYGDRTYSISEVVELMNKLVS